MATRSLKYRNKFLALALLSLSVSDGIEAMCTKYVVTAARSCLDEVQAQKVAQLY